MAGPLGRVVGVLTLLFASACTQNSQTVTLRSLESSGTFSFVCLGAGFGARDLDDCPDVDPVDGEDRHLIALVTQATRGEVALVDLTSGKVVDDEPTVPGFNFLPVGGEPRAIVSTPGSVASFVGVAEVGREGIYALPTSCLAPRAPGERMRDLTVWPACMLPSAPGEITVLIDHPVDGDGDPATPPAPHCASSFPTATSEEIESRECPADLSLETVNPGRRLLAVELPESGEIAMVDAQALLDRPPGSFDPCPIQSITKLRVDLPVDPPQQVLPPDLDLPGATRPIGFPRETVGYEPRPAGAALVDDPRTGEETLYISDRESPVIHVVDAKNPCALQEKAPLLPMAFTDPTRVVTSKRVAASPLTSEAKRYLYAIDEFDQASVMIFDVSPGATDRTPLLRPRAALMPFEPPDRIKFPALAKDVTFAFRDRVEVDPVTGSQRVGILCDPDPSLDRNAPAAQYRPNLDFTAGAAPVRLRGVFGFVALSSGSIAVIDVEDFDAKCRRSIVPNASSTPDFRGCSGDPDIESFTDSQSRSTVTNELSCNAIAPHRARSALFVLNNSEVGGAVAPALRALPLLTSEAGRTVPNDASEEGRLSPKMLGVNFGERPDPPEPWTTQAQVYVGTTLYKLDSIDSPLVIDPTKAEENSLVLDMTEPRAFPAAEQFSAVYEGVLFNERSSATFRLSAGVASLTDGSSPTLCASGVEDVEIARTRGRALGVPEGKPLDDFSAGHADYVRITSDLLDEADAYWSRAGSKCGGATQPGEGFLQCRTLLGTRDAMRAEREFTVTESYIDKLVLKPRLNPDDAALSELVACCFPQSVSYEVRGGKTWVVRGSGSGYRHDLTSDPEAPHRCELDTDPLHSQRRGRVYEVSCAPESTDCAVPADDGTFTPTSIGLAQREEGPNRDVACVVQSPTAITTVGDPCVYQGLTSRFVIYRGQRGESLRDWKFTWEVSGGFTPLAFNLAVSSDPNSMPQSMVFSRQLGDLVIADGASKGLVTVDLGTFQTQFFF